MALLSVQRHLLPWMPASAAWQEEAETSVISAAAAAAWCELRGGMLGREAEEWLLLAAGPALPETFSADA